ncbi:MAG: hypothetical protein SOY70_02620 [Veillonellaceae bacterium]|nr:hypothetical protein [Veillonellaceae bacterium]
MDNEVYDLPFLVNYIKKQNEKGQYGVPEDKYLDIANAVSFLHSGMYRVLVRLLLSNWKELSARLATFTEEDWKDAQEVADKTGLDRTIIAMLLETFDGPDTAFAKGGGVMTPEEKKMIHSYDRKRPGEGDHERS